MFECVDEVGHGPVVPLSNAQLAQFRVALAGFEAAAGEQARLQRIELLEQLRAAVAAAQAREVTAFLGAARVAAEADVAARPVPGVGTRRRLAEAERAAVARVALARRESPSQATRYAGFAAAAQADYPVAFARLAAGEVSERRVQGLHRVTSWLGPADRRSLDAELAPRMDTWGDARVEREGRAAAYRSDPKGACERVARAEADRAVSVRPAPECMSWVSACVPMAQGVAVFAALHQAAVTAKAQGDSRSHHQVMADTLVARVTGQATAEDVAVEIHLVITDQALAEAAAAEEPQRWTPPVCPDTRAGTRSEVEAWAADVIPLRRPVPGPAPIPETDAAGRGSPPVRPPDRGGADEPARVVGFGPMPAAVARRLLLGDPDGNRGADERVDPPGTTAARRVRRLFTDPAGRLVAMESRSRTFTPAMARLIRVRDDTCRTPWCDAPIRHVDHVVPHVEGGRTVVGNGRGLCARCNLTQGHLVPGAAGATAADRPDTTPPDLPGTPRAVARPSTPGPALPDIVWTGRDNRVA